LGGGAPPRRGDQPPLLVRRTAAGELPVDRANLPAGVHTSASTENLAHFLIAQLIGGRFGDTAILSPEGIAAMQRPITPKASGDEFDAMDWSVGPVGGATAIYKVATTPISKPRYLSFQSTGLGSCC
jgi:hypothetical protein